MRRAVSGTVVAPVTDAGRRALLAAGLALGALAIASLSLLGLTARLRRRVEVR